MSFNSSTQIITFTIPSEFWEDLEVQLPTLTNPVVKYSEVESEDFLWHSNRNEISFPNMDLKRFFNYKVIKQLLKSLQIDELLR